MGVALAVSSFGMTVMAESESGPEETAVADDGDLAYVPAEDAKVLEDHAELIAYLKEDDYEAAENYVHSLRVQEEKEAAGDIEDYLVKVDITEDNFFDYFDFVVYPYLNDFDELEFMAMGIVSKKRDDGLVFYDDGNVSFDVQVSGLSNNLVLTVGEGLNIWNMVGFDPNMSEQSITLQRVAPGTVTFIEEEYVQSEEYEVPNQNPSGWETNIIELKNGEILKRYTRTEHPY